MSLDWHPQHTSLLAVGCYDGSVKVFDMRVRRSAPLYSSVPGHGQHRCGCWQGPAVAHMCHVMAVLQPHQQAAAVLLACFGSPEVLLALSMMAAMTSSLLPLAVAQSTTGLSGPAKL